MVFLNKEISHIVIDQFSARLFFKLWQSKSAQIDLTIVRLPRRYPIYAWFMEKLVKIFPASRMFSLECFWTKMCYLLWPNIKFVDVDLNMFLQAKEKSGMLGVQLTERLFAEWYRCQKGYMDTFRCMFFGDPDIFLAQKKNLCQVIENVLYKYFAAMDYGKDKEALVIFSEVENVFFVNNAIEKELIKKTRNGKTSYIAWSSGWETTDYFFRALFYNALMMGALLIRPLFGKISITQKQDKLNADVAMHNFYSTGRAHGEPLESTMYWGDGAFLIDEKIFRKEDLLILANRYTSSGEVQFMENYCQAGLKVFDVSKAKMSLKVYLGLLKRSLFPIFGLIGRSLFCMERILLVSLILKILKQAILWEAVCNAVTFKAFLDIEEHSYPHIIKTIVFKQYGAWTVFLPHGILQYLSYVKAYIAYDVMFTPGNHFPLAYGSYWKQDMIIQAVGNIKNDGVLAYGHGGRSSSKKFEEIISNLNEQKRKIVAFFPGSVIDQTTHERLIQFSYLAVQTVERFKDITIILKPKQAEQGAFLRRGVCNKIIAPYLETERILIVDGAEEASCSVQCLALVADACVVFSGYCQSVSSAWIEALMLNRPAFSFDPVDSAIATPLLDQFYGYLIFRTEKEILDVLEQVLEKKSWSMPCWERVQEYFDPYCDRKALHRVRRTLKDLIENEEFFMERQKTVKEFLPSIKHIRAGAEWN